MRSDCFRPVERGKDEAVGENIGVNTHANLEFTDGGLISQIGSKTESTLLQHVYKRRKEYVTLST